NLTRGLGQIYLDLLGSDGLGAYGTTRDFINSALLTDYQAVLKATATGTLFVVRRMLLPLGGESDSLERRAVYSPFVWWCGSMNLSNLGTIGLGVSRDQIYPGSYRPDTQPVAQPSSPARDTATPAPMTVASHAVAISWIGILIALVLLR